MRDGARAINLEGVGTEKVLYPSCRTPNQGAAALNSKQMGERRLAAFVLLTALQLPARIPAESWQKVLPVEGGCLIGERLCTSLPFMMWLGKICSRTGIQAAKKKLL